MKVKANKKINQKQYLIRFNVLLISIFNLRLWNQNNLRQQKKLLTIGSKS